MTPPISFSTSRDLERHLSTHARTRRRTQCPYCLRTVGRSDNLKRHIKVAHPSELPVLDECDDDVAEETTSTDDTTPSNNTRSPVDADGSESPKSDEGRSQADEPLPTLLNSTPPVCPPAAEKEHQRDRIDVDERLDLERQRGMRLLKSKGSTDMNTEGGSPALVYERPRNKRG